MTLFDIETGKKIERVPYAREFEAVKKRLDAAEFEAIVRRINELIEESIAKSGKNIATAGWLPGRDWTGTVFEPIYTKGTRANYDLSARWFGLAVWYVIMQHPLDWGSGRYKLGDRDIGSRTYFRIDRSGAGGGRNA
jgi:hypothetical protein